PTGPMTRQEKRMRFNAPHLKEADHQPLHPDALFIDGEWRAPASKDRLQLISPVTEEVIGSVAAATAVDIDRAVAAARQAFDHGPWPRMSVSMRAEKMRELGRQLTARADALAYLWTLEAGAPVSFTTRLSHAGAMLASYYADVAEQARFVETRERMTG